jgi:GNAT superfamily N-acetyltransferase
MPELLSFPQAKLPAEIECQVLSFLRIVWPEGFLGENRLRNWITRSEHHPISFVLVENGLLIAHAQVVWKLLEHAGETYKTYGITGVFTYPSFRGQGYGLQVVQAATTYITHSDADVGMFHCNPPLKAFYAQAGWIPMPGAVTLIGARETPDLVLELMMMQFFSEKGQRGKESFLTQPVFFDEDSTW